MTTVMQAMFIDFLYITQRFIGEIKITLHYITLQYYVHHLPLVTEQVSNCHQLLPSLITLNAKGLLTPLQQAHGVTPTWETSGISQQLTECLARSVQGEVAV